MPDPIQSVASSPYLPVEGQSQEENSGQVCLAPVLPSTTSAETNAAGASSNAVTSLVTRFTLPTGSHPPVEPSLRVAVANCGWEVANPAVTVAATLVAPAGLAATLLTGARSLIAVGSAERCIERDEARQVLEGERANQAADCARDGAVPLTTADGSVVCASR
jgi:hypothetical protein